MLRLTFHSGSSAAVADALMISELEVVGGALSCELDPRSVATHRHGSWEHSGCRYSTVALMSGGCRLLLQITRELTIISDPIEHFCFIGPTLSANGVAVAKYIAGRDLWHGIVRPLWWRAMRIVTADHVAASVDDSQLVLLNPWEAESSEGGVPDYSVTDTPWGPGSNSKEGRDELHWHDYHGRFRRGH